ncbi:hypothetical protein PMAYCL1PPCAC_26833, partial [Pristionchus mayeri]
PLVSDVFFHFVFDPAPLFPLPCLYRWQPVLPLPGSACICYVIWVLTLVWDFCAYAACFIYRHQAVLPPGFPGKLSERSRLIALGSLVVVTSVCGPTLMVSTREDK